MLVSLVLLIAAVSTATLSSALGESLGRDDGTEPSVRVHEADIEATDIETAAHSALLAAQETSTPPPPAYNDATFRQMCEQRLPRRLPDVVASASWTTPELRAGDVDVRARCVLTLH